jgi:hypothetical protein
VTIAEGVYRPCLGAEVTVGDSILADAIARGTNPSCPTPPGYRVFHSDATSVPSVN